MLGKQGSEVPMTRDKQLAQKGNNKPWKLPGNHAYTVPLPRLCTGREGGCSEATCVPEVAKIQASAQGEILGNKGDQSIGLGSALLRRVGGWLTYSKKACLPGQTMNRAPEKREDISSVEDTERLDSLNS